MFEMHVPTKILFGRGVLNALHEQEMPGRKAMVVISDGKSTRANGYLDRTLQQLDKAGVSTAVFNCVQANPLATTVMEGARFARDNACDFLVALGGGSVMDAAKAMASMAVNPGDVWDYVKSGTGKGRAQENKPLPLIAITTTAGTGSEIDSWGVISNDTTNEKITFGGLPENFPVLAVVDAELMLTVPPLYTAYQGFDALFHSAEGYISCVANQMSDMYALESIRRISKSLARAVEDGSDIEAREDLAFANTLSGVVMTLSACTSEHSLEHAMSAYHQELPHGAGLIMVSRAYYTHLIERHACDERFTKMARAMGKPDASKPMDFVDALVELQEACGVSDLRMSDYGIEPSEFEKLAKNARETMGVLFMCDPVQLTDQDSVAIFEASFK